MSKTVIIRECNSGYVATYIDDIAEQRKAYSDKDRKTMMDEVFNFIAEHR